MIRVGKNLLFVLLTIGVGFIVACSNDAAIKEEEDIQVKEDSIVQAKLDSVIIGDYISDPANSIDPANLDTTSASVVYGLLATGNGDFPEINDIVSVNYTGRFTDNTVFDTSIESLAIESDSLAWVDMGVDFTADTAFVADDTVVIGNQDIEQALNLLSRSSEPLPVTVFFINRVYAPLIYNYTEDGRFIPTIYPATGPLLQFRIGLNLVTAQMDLGATSFLIMPSASAYGTIGTLNGNRVPDDRILPNTVILFDFNMVYIRK